MWSRPEILRDQEDAAPFAVVEGARAIGPDDSGPIVSIHKAESAALKASKSKGLKAPKVVMLSTHREYHRGDHVGRADIQLPKDPHWATRKANNDERMLGFFQKMWRNQ